MLLPETDCALHWSLNSLFRKTVIPFSKNISNGRASTQLTVQFEQLFG